TSYTVAIYEYAGTGVDTDYLQLNPAEATQITTDYAIHNQDFNVNCTECHNAHSQWFARGTELKGICETCHNPTGRANAKLEFDNHLLPNKNPGIDNVDCGMCHELHNFGGGNTTLATNAITSLTDYNKSFLRANVNKYVPNATTPAFLHNDQPKRDEAHPEGPLAANTPERAVEGGDDTTSRCYCQNCHTLTKYHTNNPSVSASDQCHDGETGNCGPAETHCGECHQHNNKFIGVGGTQTCIECHSSAQGSRPIITTQFDRASTHIPGGSATATQEDCLVCHDQGGHQSGVISTWDADDGATSYAQPTANAPTTAAGEGEAYEGHCLSCHDDGVAASLAASGSDQTQTSPFTGSAAPPVIDEVAWASAGHKRDYATYPSSPVSCIGDGATGCHGSGHGSENVALLAPVGGPTQSLTTFCYECHDADGPSSYNILTQFNNGTDYQTTSGSGALVNQRHDITAADQAYSGGAVSCADCHSPHSDNATNPVSDPDDGSALATYSPANSYTDDGHNFTYDPGGNSNPNAPEGGGSVTEPDFINFCLTCHDGTAPPGVTIPVDLVNMASAWDSDQHGTGEGSTGSRFGKGSLKFPYTDGTPTDPANPYAAMNCNTCHGAHGSGNIFNLRETISVAGTAMQVGGSAGSEFDTLSGTIYYLPTNGDRNQDAHQWGAWCTFCHDMSAHAGVDETVTCTSGHMHGANNF
ncbi:MAG: cytochrome c3 family protein, partial [Pseudomonadales bacterium]|nr:cytochrome c3 family protein [Pseudomonadales bacterium]